MKGLAAWAVLCLAGCTAVDFQAVVVDSASPVGAAEQLACPGALTTQLGCVARVEARQWTSPTGIQMTPGQTVCLTVLPDQVWFDADRRHTPPHGEQGTWLMRVPPRRHDAPFFSLIADLVDAQGTVVTGAAQVMGTGDNFRFKANSAGQLVLYPNDALGPGFAPDLWYRNNAGAIWVRIASCGD
jgi:hypothetical protein